MTDTNERPSVYVRADLDHPPAKPTASKPLEYDWLPEARQLAAQCWCDPTTSGIAMDAALAEVVARNIAAWMQTGAFHARNEEYWRERAELAEARMQKPAAGAVELPPLPQHCWSHNGTAAYSKQAMRDYARAAVLAERERAAGQEPVAWQIFHPNGQTCGIYATWPRGVLSDNEKANGWGVRPLYTRQLAQPSSLERLRGEVEQMKRKAQGMIPEAWNDAIDAVLAKLGKDAPPAGQIAPGAANEGGEHG